MTDGDATGRPPRLRAAARAFADTAPRREAVQALQAAFEHLMAVMRLGDTTLQDEADGRLRAAVDAARDTGVAWGQIGDVLGITRGNAYQRYRRPPGKRKD